ncbi:hypothetical protein PAXINDRAFT_104101 [Paxillus involutus ATCC 200175]|jgi:hypothetical protein|uniref:Uncharacterized protein n=1 Tax=Paxillus involutus ATCC 200175 TaxID=664439 RepID=A0A0C9SZP0_PAXIN|nr:hypothetical protein PAXINDRAFT_104101 [Paxillus involutus ATCC 200175]
MDVDALRCYHIPCQAFFPSLGPFTNFLATKTHLVKVSDVVELEVGLHSLVECYPIPFTKEILDSNVLHLSHQGRVYFEMQSLSVIDESSLDSRAAQITFTLAGSTDDDRLSLINTCLEPSGSVASKKVDLLRVSMASYLYLDSTNGHGSTLCTITPKAKSMALTFDYGQDSVSLSCSDMVMMPTSGDPPELVAFDAFGGTAFIERVLAYGRGVETLEFASDARQSETFAAEQWVVQLGWT